MFLHNHPSSHARSFLTVLFVFFAVTGSVVSFVHVAAVPVAAHDGTHDTPLGTPGLGATNPSEFTTETVADNLVQPISLAFLPDGRLLILQKGGEIVITDPTTSDLSRESYMTITNLNTTGELGLISIVLDPDFQQNGHFYLYYQPDSPKQSRVARFTHIENSGGLSSRGDLSSETVIWEDPDPYVGQYHFGGGFDFGPDGLLYLTVGEQFDPSLSQDLTNAGGKIHRFYSNGSVPADNPYVDNASIPDTIWAYGLRNPYRAQWDIPTHRFFIGDVGGNVATSREEVNLGEAGANYAWPICEGDCPGSQYTDPLYSYPHLNDRGAVIAGPVYRGSQYPSEYTGAFFFADYTMNDIRYLTFDDTGAVTGDYKFRDISGRPVDLVEGPDGALYYSRILYGSVKRVEYAFATNAPYITGVSANVTEGGVPLTVEFTGFASDPDNEALTYTWEFGDGQTATGSVVTHTYSSNGVYQAQLRVTDASGNEDVSDPIEITVGSRPTVQIDSPTDGLTFVAGDTITYSGSATTAAGDPVSPENLSWTVVFTHNDHTHPVLGPVSGSGGSFNIQRTGHDYVGDTGYRISLTTTDPDTGLSATESVNIDPQKVDLTMQTSPSGLDVLIDGIPAQTPYVHDTIVGFDHTFEAPASQCLVGTNYEFDSWSDGGARSHVVRAPTTDTTYTATYVANGSCTSNANVPTNGLVARYEATQGVTSSGGVVSGWTDQSVNGNDLTAVGDPTLVADSPNGQPVVAFDGSGDALIRTGTNGLPTGDADRTVVTLVRYDSGGFGGVGYGSPALNQLFGLSVHPDGRLSLQGWGRSNDFHSSTVGTGAGWLTQSAVHENGAFTHYKDGVAIDSASHTYATSSEKIVVGAEIDESPYVDMDVAAILVYDRALSDTERQQVEDYLRQEYVDTTQGTASVSITSPTEGETVTGSDLTVSWDATAATAGDHVHIQLDDQPYVGGQSLSGSYTFTGVSEGPHTVTAQVASFDHIEYTNPESRDVVNITVAAPTGDTAPVANDDSASVTQGGSVSIDVLANDTDADGDIDPTTVQVVSFPESGTVVVDAVTGAIEYTHDGLATTIDTLTYTVADSTGNVSNEATVSITIGPVPSTAPVANDDSATVTQGSSVSVDVLANDTDPNGDIDPTTVQVTQFPASGTVVVDAVTGAVEYTHDGSTTTSDSFRYTVADSTGNVSNEATVSVAISVPPSSDLPVTSGLALHLDSTTGVSTSGGAVTAWTDQSGNGNDLTASGGPTLATSPTGEQVVRFDGVDDIATRTSGVSGLPTNNADRTVFLVADYQGTGFGGAGYGSPALNQLFGLSVHPDGRLSLQGWGRSNDFHSSTVGTGAGWLTQSAVHENGAFVHYKDGVAIDSASHTYATSSEKIVVGAEIDESPYVDMDVAAVIVYDRALSDTERQQVEDYLRQRYIEAPQTTASVSITDPVDGATITGSDLTVSWDATAAATGDHVHLSLDGGSVVEDLPLSGTYTFTGVSEGSHTVTATVADSGHTEYTNLEATDSVSVTLEAPTTNTAPVATDDSATVTQSGSVTVDVLANDTDADGDIDPTTVQVTQSPASGSVVVDAVTGAIEYTHDGSATTSDSFAYTVADSTGNVSNEATVSVTIEAVPTSSAPVATDDSATVTQGGSVIVDVLSNDVDADGDIDPTTVQVTQFPASGNVIVDAVTGAIEYTHDGSATTSDSFRYTVADSTGNVSNEATVSVAISAPPSSDLPVTSGLALHLDSTTGVTTSGGAVTNWADQSGNGNDLTASGGPTLATSPTGEQVVRFDGVDDIASRTTGVSGLPTNNADRTVFLVADYQGTGFGGAGYGSPALNQLFGLSVHPDGRLSLQGWGRSNDFHSSTVGTGAGWLTQSAVHENGAFVHYKDGVAIDSASHTYATSSEKIVVGAEIDESPYVDMNVAAFIVYDRALSDTERQQVEDYLRQRYIEAPQTTASVSITSPTEGATITGSDLAVSWDATAAATGDHVHLSLDGGPVVEDLPLSGTYTFTGVSAGSHVITARVADSSHTEYTNPEATDSVSVTLEEVTTGDTAPVASDDSTTATAGGSVIVDVLANDVDADGDIDPTTVQVTQTPASGTVIVDAVTGAIEYTHDGSTTTSDSFSYTVADATGNVSNEATVSVTVETPATNSAPVASDDSATVTQGGSVTVDVLANDTDADDDIDPTTVQVVAFPTSGSVVVDAVTGAIEYTHDGSATTSDSFTYTVADSTGNVSNEATVSVTIEPAPTSSAPVASDDSTTVVQGGSTSIDVLANDADADGDIDSSTVQVTQLPTVGSVVVDAVTGAVEYTHDGSATTSDSFTYTVADSTGNVSNEATVSVSISTPPSSDLPVTSGLALHLDSTTGVSTSGGAVTNWADQSGNGNDLTASGGPTLATSPTGTQVVRFDGVDDIATRTSGVSGLPTNNADRTVFLVAEYRGTGFGGAGYGSPALNQLFGLSVHPDGRLSLQGWGRSNDFHSSTVGTGAGWLTQSAVHENGAFVHYKDGVAIDSASHTYATSAEKIIVGAEIDENPYVDMDVAAFIVYDRALSDTERQQVEDYLRQQYIEAPAINTAPVATDDSATVTQGEAVSVAVLANDADSDGTLDPASVTVTSSPASGQAVVDTTTGDIEYTHDGSATTSDSFTYTVDDDGGATSNETTVSITVDAVTTSSAPVANDDSATVTQGESVSIDVLANDVDADGDIDSSTVQVTQFPASGAVVVDAVTGAIEYTHDGSATTSDSFTYTVADSTGNVSNEATVSVTVEATSSVPVANDDSTTVTQGESVSIGVLTNDVDADGDIDPATLQVTQSPASGAVVVDTVTGTVEYTHDGSATTSDSFSYTVADSTGNVSNEAIVSVSVEATSSAPVAADDSATVPLGQSVSIDVLANDADADGDIAPTTVQVTQLPTAGSIVVDTTTGVIEYTHDGSATTSDSFTYTVADSTGNVSNEATVSVTVEATTTAPVASDDSTTVTQGESVSVDVLSNDVDADGDLDPTTVQVTQSPTSGTVIVDAVTGAIEYTHDGSETTSDSFSYTVADSTGNVSNEATVSVTIEAVPTSSAPVATDDSATVTQGGSTTVDVLSNDADADGDIDSSTVQVTQSPASGTVVVDAVTGAVEYTHDGSTTTSDSFRYTVADSTGNVSNEATVSVTIDLTSSAPVANDDSATVTQGESVSIDVLANDADADSDIDSSTVQVTQLPTSGTVVVDAVTGAVEYTHDGSTTTSDSFTYTVADSTGNVSNEATVSVAVEATSTAPVANDDSATVTQGESVSVDVLANDVDADGDIDSSTVQVTQSPASGVVVVDAVTGAIEYTHDGSATTSDSFSYTVADSTGNVSNEATVSVTVEAVPTTSAPVAADDSATVTQGESVSIDVLANDADADGDIDSSTVQVTQLPTSGTVVVDTVTGAIEYTHDGSATTSDSFAYTVADSTGNVSNEATVSLTVDVTTSAPVAADDTATVTQGESITVDVLANDADADGDIDSSTVQVTQLPASGSVIVDAVTGAIEYTHDGSATTSDSFSYTVADSTGNVSNEATVSVTIDATSSAPVASDDSTTVSQGESVSVDVLANDVDADGDIDSSTVQVTQSPVSGTVVVDAVTGAIEYTHDGSATTSDSFSYTVADSTGNVSNEATVSVTIELASSAPVTTDDSVTVSQGESVSVDVLANDADADGDIDSTSVVVVQSPSAGATTVDAVTGAIEYTHDGSATTSDSFTYTVADSTGNVSNEATVSVTVEATSTAPVANADSAAVTQGESVIVDVLANDTDADGDIDPTTVQVTQSPASGIVVVDTVTGTIEYTHDGSATTSDSFSYTVADSTGNVSNEATVSLTIEPLPTSNAPVATDDSTTVTQGESVSVDVLANDADADGDIDPTTVQVTQSPVSGAVVVDPTTGAIEYTHDGSATTSDSFTYTVADSTGNVSNEATVSVTVELTSSAPVTTDDSATVTQGESVSVDVLANDNDADGDIDPTTVQVAQSPATGSVVVDSTTGAIEYTHDGSSTTSDSFTYTVADSTGNVSNEATVSVTVELTTSAPVTTDDSASVTQSESVIVDVLANDADADGDIDPTTVQVTQSPASGTVVVDATTGTIEYTHDGSATTSDSFAYTVADSTGNVSNEATVSVTVELTSSAPVASDDSATVSQSESVSIDVLSNDADADGDIDPTTVQVTQSPASGTVTVDAVTGAIEYTHDGSATTSDSFTYTVADSTGNVSNEATVSVTVELTSSAPVATDDGATVTQGESVTVDVLANDADADGDLDPTSVLVVQSPGVGTTTVDPTTGTIEYTHDGSATTSDSFTYTVADSTGNVSNEAAVSVTIELTSSAPVATGDSATVTQGESVSVDVLANDADADGDLDPTTVQVTQSPASGTVVVDAVTGVVEYTHDGSATTSDSFSYTVADATGNVSNEATVSLTVEATTSAPVANDDSATVTAGGNVSVDVLANDTDVDGDIDPSTVQVTQSPASGTVIVDAVTGAIEYTHDGSTTTSDSFSYTVADSTGNVSNEATVSVTVA